MTSKIEFDMFVVGSLNSDVFDEVHEIFFIDENCHVHDDNKLMNQQDIYQTK